MSKKMEVLTPKRNYKDSQNLHNTCGQILDLGKDYKLSQPIQYLIEHKNGELIGSIDTLNIYEYAETMEELNKALKAYLIRLFKMLSDKEDKKLSKELRAQKKKLNLLIIPRISKE